MQSRRVPGTWAAECLVSATDDFYTGAKSWHTLGHLTRYDWRCVWTFDSQRLNFPNLSNEISKFWKCKVPKGLRPLNWALSKLGGDLKISSQCDPPAPARTQTEAGNPNEEVSCRSKSWAHQLRLGTTAMSKFQLLIFFTDQVTWPIPTINHPRSGFPLLEKQHFMDMQKIACVWAAIQKRPCWGTKCWRFGSNSSLRYMILNHQRTVCYKIRD